MRANLLRSVSHDLRTPLTTIYGSSQALIENYESLTDTQHMELLEGIREDTQWLIHMVENLLSVTRIGDTDVNLIKTSVVLEELIDSVLVKFQKWFPDQTVEATLPDEFVCIAVDSVLIQQVLGNLLENAVFHAEGMPRIILTIYKNEEKVLFEVADDGAGIPFEMLGSIFTGYYEKNYRGTPADLSSLYEKDLKTMSGNKHKILIVEDEENILKFVKTVLSAHGYSVLCAKSGLDGWMLFESHCPDLVILDLGANDYVTKPFGTAELEARIRNALRNSNRWLERGSILQGRFKMGALEIDYDARRLFVDGQEVKLTQTEYNIVSLLSKQAGKVMTYAEIIQVIWGWNDSGSTKKLQVNMANIRKKFGERPGAARYIHNELGVGYRMNAEEEV